MPKKRSVEDRLKEAKDRMDRLRDEMKMREIKERMARRSPARKRR